MKRRSFLAAAAGAQPEFAPDAKFRSWLKRAPGQVNLFALNLDNGRGFGSGENVRVRTASTIKLPIMAACFDLVRSGQLQWNEKLLLREEDKVSGSGVLHECSPGLRLPVRDLIHLMIVVSDNTATNLILDRISADTVNRFMDRLGLPQTRSLRKVRGDGTELKEASGWSQAGMIEENRRFGLGVSTPAEMVSLLRKLDTGEVVSSESSKEMIAILKRQQFKDGIGRRLGKLEVASKSGALDALRSDAGIVYGPKSRVAMAITVDGMKEVDYSQENSGLIWIAHAAELILRQIG